MEILCRCGEITDLDVIPGAQLEKTLQTGAGMLRPQSLQTMGEAPQLDFKALVANLPGELNVENL